MVKGEGKQLRYLDGSKNKIKFGGWKGNLQRKWSTLRHVVVIDVADAFFVVSVAKETVCDSRLIEPNALAIKVVIEISLLQVYKEKERRETYEDNPSPRRYSSMALASNHLSSNLLVIYSKSNPILFKRWTVSCAYIHWTLAGLRSSHIYVKIIILNPSGREWYQTLMLMLEMCGSG